MGRAGMPDPITTINFGKAMSTVTRHLVILSLLGFFSTGIAAADPTAAQNVTAECRAQVKEQAKYHEMSLYARHKAVKKCVQQAAAKQ